MVSSIFCLYIFEGTHFQRYVLLFFWLEYQAVSIALEENGVLISFNTCLRIT